MKEITDKEYELFIKLKNILAYSKPGTYFICGEGGDKDRMGLPERVLICPTEGSDATVIYKKEVKC